MKWPLTKMLPALLLLLACAQPACGLAAQLKPKPKDTGGFFLVVAVKGGAERLAESVERTMAVFRRRCERLGLYCEARRHEGGGPGRIMLRVSGARDAARAKGVLLAKGFELRALVTPPNPAPPITYATRAEAEAAARTAGGNVLPYVETVDDAPDPGESFVVVERELLAGGNDVRDAQAVEIYEDSFSVHFAFRPEAGMRFGRWTRANINRYIAVIWNGRVLSAPYIKSEITLDGQIDGNFTREGAREVALVLNTGNLPAPVELLEEGTYRPSAARAPRER